MSGVLKPNEKQNLIDEFILLTESDDQTAQRYLRKHQWNAVEAINDFFEWQHQQFKDSSDQSISNASTSLDLKTKNQDDQNDEKCDTLARKKIKSETSTLPRLFRHITYNIDGLNDKNLELRTRAVCKIIKEEKGTLIFLQEVISTSECIIREELANEYHIFSGYQVNSLEYYTMTLVQKEPWIHVLDIDDKNEHYKILDFPKTMMGRNILQVDVQLEDSFICLLNTHLESTKEFEELRKRQMAYLLKTIQSIHSNEWTIIAAGDLNIRDKEIKEIGDLPSNIEDAWISNGKRKECQYTWDMWRNDNLEIGTRFKPRMRFDRVLIRKSTPVKIDLVHFGLIGLKRLKPHVCFPSDHWGIITSYQLTSN